ncbi:MOSC N-terminal beta barrel domain-containing protein [Streptomyces sp. NBC_01537]|uniref:MOSC domain-containing protein n=1 Tax=Streptomyces sp. NBC_01537 TaxID=2903896 RepID=UPI00386F0947
MAVTVHTLTYYPVKGCAGVSVAAGEVAEVTATGLAHDRAFMVVDAGDGSFRSQRNDPRLAVVGAGVLDDGKRLRLTAPGAGTLELDVAFDGERREVSLFGRPMGEAVDQGAEVAGWFSDLLGSRCRLVRVRPGFDRDGWGENPGKVNFADAHAISLASLASLDDLNGRILERGAEPVPMDRFRANIVITGWPGPHTEDRFRHLTIGTVGLGYSVRAMRCAVPMVDQATGRPSGPEPIRTLAGYRREPDYDGKVSFATKAAVLREGTLAVGDEVRVHTWEAGFQP